MPMDAKGNAKATHWYSAHLSPEQCSAIEKSVSTSSILASAGSGKTRTLVYAIVDDVVRGIPPESIIAFTFTKKAALELLARVHYLLRDVAPGRDFSSLSIGTIHSWCFEYLLTKPKFYNFEPLDEDIQVFSLAARLHDELGIEAAYGKSFPKGIRPFLDDLQVFYNENLAIADVPETVRPCIEKFEQALMTNRLLTFGSMVTCATKHLRLDGPVANLRRLYVDEYQDVNPSQVELIKAMLPAEAKVIAVGDDLQCIYNWRGSDVGRIINFQHDFVGAASSELVDNYRSRHRIVEFCNAASEKIINRYPKLMSSNRGDSECSGVFHESCHDETEQSKRIADTIEELHNNGTPYSAIAVLYRSVRSAAPSILAELSLRGIPVNCPLQRECGDFLDHFLIPVLEWLENDHPEARNEEEEKEIQAKIDAFWTSVKPFLKGKAEDPAEFWPALSKWRKSIIDNDSAAYNVRGQLYNFLSFCGIQVRKGDRALGMALGISSQIIRSVEEIHRRRLVGSKRKSAKGMMREILYAVDMFKDELGESIALESTEDAVLLTTVHQSKGLEWPVVIIGTLNRNRFPVRRSPHGTSFSDEVAARYGTSEQDEWRLFYVASSRARERLFLFDYADGNTDKQSVFLTDLATALAKALPPPTQQSISKLTHEELKSHHDVPLRLGLSELLVYAECPFQYALRKLVGIQPSIADDLGYGKSIHELAQRRFNANKDWSKKELDEQVENFVHLPYVGDIQLDKSKEAIRKRISGLQSAGAFKGETTPEMKTEVAFKDGLVHGVIDCVIKDGDGFFIRDWKTNVHKEFIDRYGDQQRFYVHALRLRGNEIKAADLVDVGETYKTGTLSSLPLDISNEAVSKTFNRLDAALVGIAKKDFTPVPSTLSCSACDMRAVCGHRFHGET